MNLARAFADLKPHVWRRIAIGAVVLFWALVAAWVMS